MCTVPFRLRRRCVNKGTTQLDVKFRSNFWGKYRCRIIDTHIDIIGDAENIPVHDC